MNIEKVRKMAENGRVFLFLVLLSLCGGVYREDEISEKNGREDEVEMEVVLLGGRFWFCGIAFVEEFDEVGGICDVRE